MSQIIYVVNPLNNSATIEQRILELYPHLADKPQIRYLIEIGSTHQIDRGLGIPPDAVFNLFRANQSRNIYWSTAVRIMLKNASFEECKGDIARHYGWPT